MPQLPKDPPQISLEGLVNCVKQGGVLVASAGAILGAAYAGAVWLGNANQSHVATSSNAQAIQLIAETQKQIATSLKQESDRRELEAVEQERSRKRTEAACERGIIRDRDWCLLEGYPVPPKREVE